MTEDALARFLSEYSLPGRCTFYAHKPFRNLEPFAEKGEHEVGPHPVWVDLDRWKDNLESITTHLTVQPRGLRSHSCAFSHMIAIGLNDLGYRYTSNADQLFQKGIRPYRQPWGIWELPIYYMDNMDFWMPKNWPELAHQPFRRDLIEVALGSTDLFVFDFHPLHIALNTPGYQQYSAVRSRVLEGGESPFALRYEGHGTDDFFREVCAAMLAAGERSYTCAEALAHYGCE